MIADPISLPATADSIGEADAQTLKSGLELRFRPGEQYPWKGLWFEVEAVTPDRIMLRPVGETWQNHKKRTGRG